MIQYENTFKKIEITQGVTSSKRGGTNNTIQNIKKNKKYTRGDQL